MNEAAVRALDPCFLGVKAQTTWPEGRAPEFEETKDLNNGHEHKSPLSSSRSKRLAMVDIHVMAWCGCHNIG